MLGVHEIKNLFHYSTENKSSEEDKIEKNERRIKTICIKLPEVLKTIYESKKCVMGAIQIVNENYSSILSNDDIVNAINEIKIFSKIISNSHIDINTKASIVKSFDFKEYRKLLHTCKFTWLKSISRLNNMKVLANKYIHGTLSKKKYSDDMKKQMDFFNRLLSKYEGISTNNCYVYILRYDLRTIKKRNHRSKAKK